MQVAGMHMQLSKTEGHANSWRCGWEKVWWTRTAEVAERSSGGLTLGQCQAHTACIPGSRKRVQIHLASMLCEWGMSRHRFWYIL
eukprot:1159529-Pelagomonas_calceolata.AAC.4